MVANEKVLKRLSRIKEECEKCKGTGFTVSFENDCRVFNDCSCVLKIKKALSYMDANIPLRYVKWDISELTEEFMALNGQQVDVIKDFLANLQDNIDSGYGFWLAAAPGQAKSSIISYVLRHAVDAGHSCYFDKAANLHSKKFEALSDDSAKRFITHIIEDVDLLVIEEIDKIYLKDDLSINNKLFFDLISDVYDSNKSLIISSNEPQPAVLKRFPSFIADRIGALDYIPFAGGKTGRR